MLETIAAIVNINPFTTLVVAALTTGCAMIFLKMTDSPALTLVFTPVAAVGALCGIHFCRELQLYFSADKDSNLIVSSVVGLIFGLMLLALVAHAAYTISQVRQKTVTRELQKAEHPGGVDF